MRAERRRGAAVSGALLALLMLAGCAGDDAVGDAAAGTGAPGEAGLPQPQQAGGAVTDMPGQPGPGKVPLGGEPPAPDILDPTLAPLEDNPETGLLLPGDPSASAAAIPEPSPEEAAAVIRTYYAAINALDYPRAYALWSDGGRSSGPVSYTHLTLPTILRV